MREFFGYENLIFSFESHCKCTVIDVSGHTGRLKKRSEAVGLNTVGENLEKLPPVSCHRY